MSWKLVWIYLKILLLSGRHHSFMIIFSLKLLCWWTRRIMVSSAGTDTSNGDVRGVRCRRRWRARKDSNSGWSWRRRWWWDAIWNMIILMDCRNKMVIIVAFSMTLGIHQLNWRLDLRWLLLLLIQLRFIMIRIIRLMVISLKSDLASGSHLNFYHCLWDILFRSFEWI